MTGAQIPRRSIEDLIAQYELEPSLRDLFVEGEYDKDFVEMLYKIDPSKRRIVYTVDSIDISNDVLNKHSLTRGNKQEVIALVKELDKPQCRSSYRGLVDKDLDQWTNKLEIITNLIFTEYTSIEAYFLTSEIVHHLLISYAKAKISKWDTFYASFTEQLTMFFAIRIYIHTQKWKINFLSPYKSLTIKDGRIIFNVTDYFTRIITSNGLVDKKGLTKQIERIQKEVDLILAILKGDPRYYTHGHDFVDLLAWSTLKFKGSNQIGSHPPSFQRAMILMAEKANQLRQAL